MQQLFACRLEINDADPGAAFSQVLDEIADWAWRFDGEPPDLLTRPRDEVTRESHHIAWDRLEPETFDGGARVVEYTHPDSAHDGLVWKSSLHVVRADSGVRMTMRVSRGATSLRLAPAALQLGKPRIVNALVERFDCTAGDELPCKTVAGELQPGDIRPFLNDVLCLRRRVLPVLVLSPPVGRAEPDASPERLAEVLAGLAHVFVLSGHLAWERVKEEFGEKDFVPRGGARIYWPGYGGSEDDLRHRFWLRSGLSPRRGLTFMGQMLGLLAPLSVLRVPDDPLVPELRRAVASERRKAIAESGAEAALEEYEAELDREAELEDDIKELTEERDRYKALYATAQENLAASADYGGRVGAAATEEDERGAAAELEEAVDWEVVAELVEEFESDAFCLTDRARAHLREPAYPDAERMFDHIERLANAAEAYAAAGAQVGGRFDEWIYTEHSLRVALHDKGLGRGDTTFMYDGEPHSREPHVKVDDYVDPASCGRIYFARGVDPPRFIVDHIGLHL